MRVRFLVDIASFDFGYHKGDVRDIDDAVALAWCASGTAEPADSAVTATVPATAMRVGAPERAVKPRGKGARVSDYPRWSTSLKTSPTSEPVTTAEAKTQCRVEVSDDDVFIDTLIAAARQFVENFTNRALITQAWYLKLDGFPCAGPIWLPRPPTASVTSVSYVDSAGGTATWAATTGYQLTQPAGPTASYARLRPAYGTVYPTVQYQPESVTVDYTCGYGGASSVPAAIKQAMLLLVAHWYANREAVTAKTAVHSVPMAFESLLAPYVVQQFEVLRSCDVRND
jgi:uncharacterized phiE125 gp8 family phage protein